MFIQMLCFYRETLRKLSKLRVAGGRFGTVHPRLSEQLGMKFRSSCSDMLKIRVIEDVNVSRKIKTKG